MYSFCVVNSAFFTQSSTDIIIKCIKAPVCNQEPTDTSEWSNWIPGSCIHYIFNTAIYPVVKWICIFGYNST